MIDYEVDLNDLDITFTKLKIECDNATQYYVGDLRLDYVTLHSIRPFDQIVFLCEDTFIETISIHMRKDNYRKTKHGICS